MSRTLKNLSRLDYENSPKKNRYGHTMNLYNSKDKEEIFIFGGLLMNSQNMKEKKTLMYDLEFTNELLHFSFIDYKWTKKPLKTDGNTPKGRHFHSSVVFENSLFIFGGKSNGYLNDIHEYSIGMICI